MLVPDLTKLMSPFEFCWRVESKSFNIDRNMIESSNNSGPNAFNCVCICTLVSIVMTQCLQEECLRSIWHKDGHVFTSQRLPSDPVGYGVEDNEVVETEENLGPHHGSAQVKGEDATCVASWLKRRKTLRESPHRICFCNKKCWDWR